MSDVSIEQLQAWVDRSEIVEDVISLSVVEKMNATLGRDPDELQLGDPLPPSWHWLFFNRGIESRNLRIDGTYGGSEYMPPILFPRRMWAGNRIKTDQSLTIGCPAQRSTTIEEIIEKDGRSGPLIFVRERSDITDTNGGNLVDWRTLVFCDKSDRSKNEKFTCPPENPNWRQEIESDPILLFRYSALTFNSHRIHYDRDYTRDIEGYPDLLVHAPLTATLLLNLFRQEMPNAMVKEMNLVARAPIFVNSLFSINGELSGDEKKIQLWAEAEDGNLAMTIDIFLA